VNPDCIVVGSSVFFSLLVRREAALRKRFLSEPGLAFYCPRFFLVELFKHTERIVEASALTADELLECLYELLVRVRFLEEGAFPIGTWMEARRLCQEVDPKDAPFVAITLHVSGRLWTYDSELKTGLRVRGFDRFFEP
jgi:predicted nucleic acid-binding protein